MSDQNSSAEELRRRIRASAVLAAYGDALGFISELTDRSGLRRRAGVERLSTTVAWRRRVGGQFGPTLELPAGAVSDDTQLRLATCRSIQPSGAFDVETFSAVELTVWPSYALGAGRGSLAAAANLRKRDVTWATNFFRGNGTDYLAGGGNGAAMRIQPHVWATRPDAPAWSWLADVLVNAVCTHGHPRGFVGAAFHAACLDHALRSGHVPDPDDWLRIIDKLARIPEVVAIDDRMSELWRGQWESRSRDRLDEAVPIVLDELRSDARACAELSPGARGSYADAVERLKAFEPAERGSGSKTSLLAAVAAYLFAGDPVEGIRICANSIGTDTDSIATMVGAIAGAAGIAHDPGGEVQDRTYIEREADRMWAAAASSRPPRFPYPDVLAWKPPRSATDAVSTEAPQFHVAGLGPATTASAPFETSGKSPGVWQWLQLWFGQTVLVKRRARPGNVVGSQHVEPVAAYVQDELLVEPPMARSQRSPTASSQSPRTGTQRPDRPRGRHVQPPLPRGDKTARRSLNEIADEAIAAGLTDEAIGAGFREVAKHDHAIEDGIAYGAIVLKALIAREGRSRGELDVAAWQSADQSSAASAAHQLGVSLQQRGNFEGAEAAWRRADERGHPGSAVSLGALLHRRGDLDGAEAAWRRADERGSAAGAYNLGVLLQQRGDLEGAEAAWRRADERGHPGAAVSLGALLHQSDDR